MLYANQTITDPEPIRGYCCTSGRHAWEELEDAARCCGGWAIIWVPLQTEKTHKWERRLVPQKEADLLGPLRFRMPGELLRLHSQRGHDEFNTLTVIPPSRNFKDQSKLVSRKMYQCTNGHYLFSEDDAACCCNGWIQIRYVQEVDEDNLIWKFTLVRESDKARIEAFKKSDEDVIRFVRARTVATAVM